MERTLRRTGPRRWGPLRAAVLTACVPIALLGAGSTLLGACAAVGVRQQGPGGVPAPLAARLSLVVAQTRSQFPGLAGGSIPHEIRKAPADAAPPEPALRGQGVGVQPGLQTGARATIAAVLYLDKQAYDRGYLEVTPTGEGAQRWPIVASERQGAPEKTFETIYVLVAPGERVRYLVLIGGRYQEGEEEYHGFEGTLIEPGPGHDLERWERAYKLDFGFRFPVVPAHVRKVDEAVSLFRELQGDLSRLERLRDRIAADEGELDSLHAAERTAASGPAPEPAPPAGAAGQAATQAATQAAERERRIAALEQRLRSLRQERDTLAGGAETRFVRYYGLRGRIAEEFHAFTESNAWLWLGTAGKQAAYDRWKVVEFHHPRIDELVSTFLTFRDQEQGGQVLDARAAAMERINTHDNWSRDPAKGGKTRPR